MLYVVVNAATRRQQRVSVEPLEAGEGELLVTYAQLDAEPSAAVAAWNPDVGDHGDYVFFDAPTVPSTERVGGTQLEFRRKVGFSVESQLDQLQEHPDCPRNVAANIRTMFRWLASATVVRLDDAETISQTQMMAAIRANAGLMGLISVTPLTTEERDAYIAAVLTPWTDAEAV